jgi:hypothetical protein
MEANDACTLADLANVIRKEINDPWLFPLEPCGAAGFWGMGPLMFIGDQPSTNEWRECDAGRRLFYGKLLKYSSAEAHLTDFYKRRGKGSALRQWRKHGLPPDWHTIHKPVLERELAIVNPVRIVAIGGLAYELIDHFMPNLRPRLVRMAHFAYGVKPGKLLDFEVSFRLACGIVPNDYAAANEMLKNQGLSESFSVRSVYGLGPTKPSGLNPQCAALMQTLADVCAVKAFVTDHELEGALYERRHLRTHQTPWRIWTYYRERLIGGGFVRAHCLVEM